MDRIHIQQEDEQKVSFRSTAKMQSNTLASAAKYLTLDLALHSWPIPHVAILHFSCLSTVKLMKEVHPGIIPQKNKYTSIDPDSLLLFEVRTP